MKQSIRRAFLDTVPVLTGYVVLGFGFGIIMKANGFGILLTLAMSIFIYAGSMQYVAVGLFTGGASLVTAALTTLMVNARHLFYGISMLEHYKGTGRRKPYLIFALTDETYSLVSAPEGRGDLRYCFWVSLFDHIWWVGGTALGAAAGSLLQLNFQGIEFVLTALFVTIFVEQWLSTEDHRPALIGAGTTAVCLLIFGRDVFLIPSMAIIAGLLAMLKQPKKEA